MKRSIALVDFHAAGLAVGENVLTVARRSSVLVLALVLAVATIGEAQRRGGGRGGFNVRPAVPEDFDGSWQFCRVAFRGNRAGDGAGWSVDFPRADINLSVRLSELTKTTVSFSSPGEPNHLVIRLTDPTLFQCPFIMMTEVGNLFMTDEESEALRLYLLKGGFLWVDDFWGEYAWQVFAEQIGKALPPGQFPPRDLEKGHALFRALFDIGGVPQIASIGYWAGSGGDTSERGSDSAVVHARGIYDQQGRLMVLATHNTDIGDSWEEEASDPQYFYEFSTKGYAFGINTLVYAMTH
jgi:hypothetical protein